MEITTSSHVYIGYVLVLERPPGEGRSTSLPGEEGEGCSETGGMSGGGGGGNRRVRALRLAELTTPGSEEGGAVSEVGSRLPGRLVFGIAAPLNEVLCRWAEAALGKDIINFIDIWWATFRVSEGKPTDGRLLGGHLWVTWAIWHKL
ncbi:hypothetical protein EPH_0064000 [Eimeria praecox]|uniref:Uncharacterized protein n=1 Tax=Eimeria praecox TaxID=51316 RepID=U6GYW3_9EIME|nr:hypothetical protein EPH_0064000 [Eimeria praecox]